MGSGAATGCGTYRGGKYGDQLDCRWQRADDVDARKVHQFAQLLEAQRHSAARREGARRHAGRGLDDARRNGVGDPPALEQAGNVQAARTGRIPEAAGAQDSIANSLFAADVRSWRTGGYGDRHAGTSKVDSTG